MMIKLLKYELGYYRAVFLIAITLVGGTMFFGHLLSLKSSLAYLGMVQGMIAVNAFLIFPHYSEKRDRILRLIPLSAKSVGMIRIVLMLTVWLFILAVYVVLHLIFNGSAAAIVLLFRAFALLTWLSYTGAIFSLIAEISYTRLTNWLKSPLLTVLMMSIILAMIQISFFMDSDFQLAPANYLASDNSSFFSILLQSPVGLVITLLTTTLIFAISYFLQQNRTDFTGAQAGVFTNSRG
jgi:hypothetical protein